MRMNARQQPTGKPLTRSGFSLLEMLAGLGVMALIFALVAGVFQTGWRASDRTARLATVIEERAALDRVFRTTLNRLQPAPADAGPATRRLYFQGEPSRLEAAVMNPSLALPGGLYRVRFAAAPTQTGQHLVFDVLPFSLSAEERPLSRTVLSGPVGGISFSYGKSQFPGNAQSPGNAEHGLPAWTSQWQSTSQTPSLIRITIHAANPDEGPQVIIVKPALIIHDPEPRAVEREGTF